MNIKKFIIFGMLFTILYILIYIVLFYLIPENEVFELFIYEIDSYIDRIKRKGSNKEKLRYLAGKLKHNKR